MRRHRLSLAVVAATVAAGALTTPFAPLGAPIVQAATTIHVDSAAVPGGSGASWASAYDDLHDALAVATSGDEVWVAAGTYVTTSGTDRTVGFEIPDGVSIYGGFENGDGFGDRDPDANPTILSGEIGLPGLDTDNAYQVVKVVEQLNPPSPITISGFEIRDGHADGSFDLNRGAAIFMKNGQGLITLDQLVITGNTDGSSVSNRFGGAEVVMTDSVISGNGVAGASSGRVLDFASVDVTLDDLVVDSNELAGISVVGLTGTLNMRNSVVTSNLGNAAEVAGYGGTIANTVISGQGAGPGSALHVGANTGPFSQSSVVTLVNSVVANNRFEGPSQFARGIGITVHGRTFNGENQVANLVVKNSTLAMNGNDSGFGCDEFAESLTIPDVTSNREDGSPTGAVLATATFENSIVWDTASCGAFGANPVDTPDPALVTWRNSNVRASGGSGAGWNPAVGTDLGGNTEVDPKFVNLEDCRCTTGDYRLRNGSPMFDVGNNALVPADVLDLDDDGNTAETLPTDFDDGPRIEDGTVDMGAFEGVSCIPGLTRLHVRRGFGADGTGLAWNDPIEEFRDALEIADDCNEVSEIWLALGTWAPTGGTDRSASFEIPSGVSVYGGFSGTETQLAERSLNQAFSQTVLTGEIGVAGLTDNSYHVIQIPGDTADVRIDGLQIEAGNANHPTLSADRRGGAISSAEVANLVLANLFVFDNAAVDGAGISISGPGSITIANVTVSGNAASGAGGGIRVEEATVDLRNSVFDDNTAATGGAVALVDTASTLSNLTLFDNPATNGTGLVTTFVNGTTIVNTILWPETAATSSTPPTWRHSVIAGSDIAFPGTDDGGNVATDPMLGTDLRPEAGSPALDGGSDGDVPLDTIDVDADGDTTEAAPDRSNGTRISGPAVDIGAFEGADTDGDGVADADDNCPGTYNAAQTNTDADSEGDACDDDDDDDGELDVDDSCVVDVNPDQTDTDDDGAGDACDDDDDGDDVPDSSDNCRLTPNSNQFNADDDPDGDACDTDDDDDGVLDVDDNCRVVANPDQTDTDGDGVGDSCETSDPEPLLDSLVPARLLDTRPGDAFTTVDGRFEGGGRRPAGSTLELEVTGRGGVGDDAVAVALNITAVKPLARGFLTVFPCGTSQPTASNVNYEADDKIPNAVIVKVGTGGTVCIYTKESTHLLVDVNGDASASSPYLALDPARFLDTRGNGVTFDDVNARSGITSPGDIVEVVVAGRGAVPADAVAAVINLTSVRSSSNGFVTVFACGTDRPLASNVNHFAGVNRPNLVIAPIGVDGKVCIYTSGATHLLADVNGAITPDSGYLPLDPARLADTREIGETIDDLFAGDGRLTAGATLQLPVAGRGGVPADAAAAVLNVTVRGPLGTGFATVYPCDEDQPDASNLNYVAGLTAPNLVIAKLSARGEACIYVSEATHIFVDVSGSL